MNGVELGRYRMECWYFSPFPKEFYPDGYVDTLYFCEYTLRCGRMLSKGVGDGLVCRPSKGRGTWGGIKTAFFFCACPGGVAWR